MKLQAVKRSLREHLPFLLVISALTALMTFPTILYVFRTDVFWHPAGGSHDVWIEFWEYWYWGEVLSGRADRFFTNLIFYPEGVSLVNQPLNILYNSAAYLIGSALPPSNTYTLLYLLILLVCAAAAYFYLNYLFADKAIATVGAVVFAFSPHVYDNPHWPDIALLLSFPLAMYFFQRSILEGNARYALFAGLVTGLTADIAQYSFVCLVITISIFFCLYAISRWRERSFWRLIGLLIAAAALASVPRLVPILAHSSALGDMLNYYSATQSSDLVDFIINTPRNPFLGAPLHDLLRIAEGAGSNNVYLGLVPMLFGILCLALRGSRRNMLPWLITGLLFLVLSAGPILIINRITYENVLLPRHYLDQLFPAIFGAFSRSDFFMAGARLPLTVLACFGLVALKGRMPARFWRGFIVILIAVAALDSFRPIPADRVFPLWDGKFSMERLSFIDWLRAEEDQDIALINLPLLRTNANFYSFFQSIHGYPQTEASISRTPDSAYDYIRANYLLNTWNERHSVICEAANRELYVSALHQLEEDGFSHVVFYRDFYYAREIEPSFRHATAAYRDDFVSIYRLHDLRASCPPRQ